MRHLVVSKAQRLEGTVRIQGSKNSTLALMAAACMSGGTVILENIPAISDVYTFLDILKDIGAKAGFIGSNSVFINPGSITRPVIDPADTEKVRPSYYFIGSLLARHKKVSLGYPGGDKIGQRPIDQHIKGLRLMGAEVELYENHYIVRADKLKGADIYFDMITGGATLNIMMAAVLAEGTTIIHNAAKDPEVVDTAVLLNKMGACIHGAGTDSITIDGVDSLTGCTHRVIPDRLIAGTYLMAAGIASGCITVEDVIPEHILPLIYKLKEAGIHFNINNDSVTAISDGNIKPMKIVAEKFPMLETDFQQPLSVLLLKAYGMSVITDKIYPERANHCEPLRKMDANIHWYDGKAYITGGTPLRGTLVHAGDIRAGTTLVLAGLLAEGTTRITGVEHLERGFVDIVQDLTGLKADIRLMDPEFEDDRRTRKVL